MNSEETKSPEYIKYVNEIVNGFIKDMEKKFKLHCYGSGGSMPTDVEKIDVLFISYSKSQVDDARRMEITAIQNLLHRINSHIKIRPYLREFPFNTDRVNVSISFRTNTDNYPLDGTVALVFLAKNKIFYKRAEIKIAEPIPFTYLNEKKEVVKKLIGGGPREELIPLMDEPYEEALKIVGIASNPDQKQ